MALCPAQAPALEVSLALGGKQGYALFYRGVKLGRIALTDRVSPGRAGTLTPETASDRPEIRRRVRDYMQFRIEADRLARDSPHSLEEFLDLTEPGFSDVINSMEWYLVDDQGDRLGILAPTFSPDGTVRWNWRDDPR